LKQIKYFTYATPRPFGGFVMPVPAQNSCMREYVLRQEGTYVLPLLELMYSECHLQLFRLLESVPDNSQLCAYSSLMFPKSQDKIDKIDRLLINKNLKFHFVFERLIIKSTKEMQGILKSEYLFSLIPCESIDILSLLHSHKNTIS
jgi:sporadic carbohydrate cluster protein (TIGR04323 family)